MDYSTEYDADWFELEVGIQSDPCAPLPGSAERIETGKEFFDEFFDSSDPDAPIPILDPYTTFPRASELLIRGPGTAEGWNIEWNIDSATSTRNRTLIYVDGKDYVEIDGLTIAQRGHADLDLRRSTMAMGGMGGKERSGLLTAKHTILITNCDTVVLRNLCLSGPVDHSHIRIQGAREIYIDNVRIEGTKFSDLLLNEADHLPVGATPDDYVAGTGITIDNGSKHRDCDYANRLLIQNTTIRNYTAAPVGAADNDALSIRSPGSGILFNSYFENWGASRENRTSHAGGGVEEMLDIGHWANCSSQSGYADHVFRIERNVFLGCAFDEQCTRENSALIKVTGVNDSSNVLLFANNISRNTRIVDSHQGYPVFYVYGSSAFAIAERPSMYFRDIVTEPSGSPGENRHRNNLIRSLSGPMTLYETKGWYEPEPPRLNADYNVYLRSEDGMTVLRDCQRRDCRDDPLVLDIAHPKDWLREWRAGRHQDHHSEGIEDCPTLLARGSLCAGARGAIPWIGPHEPELEILRDFFGSVRNADPDVGALESASLRRLERWIFLTPPPRIARHIRCGRILGDVIESPIGCAP